MLFVLTGLTEVLEFPYAGLERGLLLMQMSDGCGLLFLLLLQRIECLFQLSLFLLLLFDDVTEQRRVERLYRRMLDYSRAGVYQYTFKSGVVVFANQGLVDILDLDCSPEELEGKRLKNLMIYVEQEASIDRISSPMRSSVRSAWWLPWSIRR